MAKNLNISIPKPCHENWGDMTPAGQGRHCSSCDKVVVDFTTMTDAQVVEYFKTSQQKTCGRFRTDQVDRKIRLRPEEKSLVPFKYIAASLIATGAFWQTSGGHDLADTVLRPVMQTVTCMDDTLVGKAVAVAVDTPVNAEADTAVMTGDTVVNDSFAIAGQTVVTISGGVGITLGFCTMQPEPTPEFDPAEIPAFKSHPYSIPYVGQVLESLRNISPFKPTGEKPDKREFNFSFAAMVNRMRLIYTSFKQTK